MSFDENPRSPEKLVDTHKPTTQVNLALVAGVLVFLLFGVVALIYFARGGD